ncbi:hypothetical protein Sked_28780 [Sanguibacter keddieii DSM 10542]|uniref:RiboL-PSP-HEPN domain-containing protein n=1 Tax=Sanguibacter keddieii (strain ATCC 51767 / DSM 10542 / NCFB 3025 / ST-74) TaxID=446469 RepID=D1BBK9_SANKS|nr:hypothetical protein [Sanguibacter keddieii]ACZ22780.1 hypothetical protein Sked_28780 [Sanguibacter keddieii DSM 10542]
MVNTLNPNDPIADFTADVQAVKQRHENIQIALKAANASGADKKGATADYIFRVGGEFELFQHRWHIAAISKKPSKFVASLNQTLATKVQALPGHGIISALGSLSLAYPAWLTAEQIETLLDESERNVTFKDVAEWKKAASKQLDSPFDSKVAQIAQSLEDTWALNLLKSTRNVIAHSSKSSLKDLNTRLAPHSPTNPDGITGSANAKLSRGVTNGVPKKVGDVSVYLHAVQGGERRADVLADRVVAIVNKLQYP